MDRVTIITPTFYGDSSGAAVYYTLLVDWLKERRIPVTVISEVAPKCHDKIDEDLDFIGLFPQRCGREKRLLADINAYSWQNIMYTKIPRIISSINSKLIIVHSSFYDFPGLFPFVIRSLIRKKTSEQQFIADVRDCLIPQKRAHYLNQYDHVIACSENVLEHLKDCGVSDEKIQYVPVLQERLKVDQEIVSQFLSSLGLDNIPYILYAGLIKEEKAVDLLLRSFTEYVRSVFPDLIFVLAGLLKTNNKTIIRLLKSKNVRYVGNMNRKELLNLMKGARMCVNISPNEGMPRSSLEALGLKRPVLLPPNVPEFEKYCSDFVVDTCDPERIASKMIEVLTSSAVPSYPIERHLPENVLSKYVYILGLD